VASVGRAVRGPELVVVQLKVYQYQEIVTLDQ